MNNPPCAPLYLCLARHPYAKRGHHVQNRGPGQKPDAAKQIDPVEFRLINLFLLYSLRLYLHPTTRHCTHRSRRYSLSGTLWGHTHTGQVLIYMCERTHWLQTSEGMENRITLLARRAPENRRDDHRITRPAGSRPCSTGSCWRARATRRCTRRGRCASSAAAARPARRRRRRGR